MDEAATAAEKNSATTSILLLDELNALFAPTEVLSYKVFFFTAYSMGLRLSEGINLRIGDIDSTNMRVHIRDSKGNKDRLVPLPRVTLKLLRTFWKEHQHPDFLFPSRKHGAKHICKATVPLDRSEIQAAMRAVITHLGIKKSSWHIFFIFYCNRKW